MRADLERLAELQQLIKTWRGQTGAPSHVTGPEWNGYRAARTRCADELERALAAKAEQSEAGGELPSLAQEVPSLATEVGGGEQPDVHTKAQEMHTSHAECSENGEKLTDGEVPLPEPFGWLVADRVVGFSFCRDEPSPEVKRSYISGPVFSPARLREYAETVAAPLREQARCWQGVAEGEVELRQLANEEIADLKRERDEARTSRDFYQRRCNMLQAEQKRMRDPERTLVCDILANGQLLPDPHGKRYGPIDSAMGDSKATVTEDVAALRNIVDGIGGKE